MPRAGTQLSRFLAPKNSNKATTLHIAWRWRGGRKRKRRRERRRRKKEKKKNRRALYNRVSLMTRTKESIPERSSPISILPSAPRARIEAWSNNYRGRKGEARGMLRKRLRPRNRYPRGIMPAIRLTKDDLEGDLVSSARHRSMISRIRKVDSRGQEALQRSCSLVGMIPSSECALEGCFRFVASVVSRLGASAERNECTGEEERLDAANTDLAGRYRESRGCS